MSRRVAHILDGGARVDYARTVALQYVFLPDLVAESYPAGDPSAERLAALSCLEGVSAQKLVDATTPFLQQNVRRVAAVAAGTAEERAVACDGLLASAFDSYFDFLPDRASVTLTAGHSVPLLSLKLMFPARAGSVTVRRIDQAHVEWAWDGGAEVVPVRGERHALPGFVVHEYPEAVLVTTASPLLMSPSHIEKLTVRPELMPQLAQMIRTSLGIITAADPSRAARLTSLIHYYFPIATPDPLTTHNSFSAADLIGVIFLSDAYNDLRLVEAIVHEYHHNELHVLLEARELFDSRPDELYYSPWRNDPRPLYGLFHAIHVFSSVVDFFIRGLGVDELKEHHPVFRERSEQILCQLHTALAQIRRDRLTAEGASIIDAAIAEVREFEAAIGPVDGRLPEGQRLHLRQWQARNPGLRAVAAE